jgi:hypothetical protein
MIHSSLLHHPPRAIPFVHKLHRLPRHPKARDLGLRSQLHIHTRSALTHTRALLFRTPHINPPLSGQPRPRQRLLRWTRLPDRGRTPLLDSWGQELVQDMTRTGLNRVLRAPLVQTTTGPLPIVRVSRAFEISPGRRVSPIFPANPPIPQQVASPVPATTRRRHMPALCALERSSRQRRKKQERWRLWTISLPPLMTARKQRGEGKNDWWQLRE